MKRLAYIDWMRGLACVLMFQTHCYDSWMSPEAKKSSSLIAWSRLGGTLPAPLFIFLAGVSFALVTEKLREKGIERGAIAKQTIMRGAEIFGMGLLFRVQEFALGYPWSPWTDLLRVDVLNILGLSMMLMGVLCWATGDGTVAATGIRTLVTGIFAAVIVAMATPPLWTTHRPEFLPWPIESYINGVHIFKEPQPWLFPLFPWSAFAFAGLAAGSGLETNGRQINRTTCFTSFDVPGPAPVPIPPQHMTLTAGCAAVDAGVILPNINDGFVGTAPDLGAYELGQPLPTYGPRTARQLAAPTNLRIVE